MEENLMPGRNGGSLKKGNTKNVGRPRKLPLLDDVMDRVLGEEKVVGKEKITALEAVIRSLVLRAIKGDVPATKVLLERLYGKPKQDVTLSGELDVNNFTPEQITVKVVNGK